MGRKRLYDAALRERLLEQAGAQVYERGVASLSLRSLAASSGTTTAAVYALFDGKPGLLAALYEQAFARFAAYQATIAPSDDPVEDVVRLGLAYRESALADPHGYRVMFGDDAKPSRATPELAETAARSFEPVLDAVRRSVRAERFPASPPPESIATALWANVHGLVSLELGEFVPPQAGAPADVFEYAVRAAVRGWEGTRSA